MTAGDNLLQFAKELADPDWSLSVPKVAKDTIARLVKVIEDTRPRTITGAEELMTLNEGAVLMSGGRIKMYDGAIWRVSGGMIVRVGKELNGVVPFRYFIDPLPVTVLHEGTP